MSRSSGLWCCVVLQQDTSVSEDLAASVFAYCNTTCCHNPEDHDVKHCENPKSQMHTGVYLLAAWKMGRLFAPCTFQNELCHEGKSVQLFCLLTLHHTLILKSWRGISCIILGLWTPLQCCETKPHKRIWWTDWGIQLQKFTLWAGSCDCNPWLLLSYMVSLSDSWQFGLLVLKVRFPVQGVWGISEEKIQA